MMSSEHIIDVDEANFENDVITYSNAVPVVVDFWAEWCRPCQHLDPILEKLAREASGSFRLAKVNADSNPNLTLRLGVLTLPTVKGFFKGHLVKDFTGLQTEPYVRDFLRSLTGGEGGLELERGDGLLAMGKYSQATRAFRTALQSDPDNDAALLGLAKSLVAEGEGSDALAVLLDFPAGKRYSDAEQLADLARSVAKLKSSPDNFLRGNESVIFRRALELVSRGNLPAAADGMLSILKEDKNTLDGEVRWAMLGLLVLMDDEDPETRQYRNELASILF